VRAEHRVCDQRDTLRALRRAVGAQLRQH